MRFRQCEHERIIFRHITYVDSGGDDAVGELLNGKMMIRRVSREDGWMWMHDCMEDGPGTMRCFMLINSLARAEYVFGNRSHWIALQWTANNNIKSPE